MTLRCAFLLCALAYGALLVVAEQESKYNEIIKLLSDTELKPAAQSYSASVADPNDYPSSGYSRSSDRSRYAPSSSSSKADRTKDDDDDKKLAEEEEEDKKPDRLALLLADSKFGCDGLKNGYYADESVGCQVFHYCVDGVKHSWQCPENTVFHQIHLNCVPNTQDICGESSKFHVVNDYLHKELNERGPNNTVLYHQRFYPEGFDVSGGDTVTQIFQAQAAAARQKARDRDSETADYEDEPPRPRSRPKPAYTPSSQAARPHSRPAYKPASRPVSIPVSSYQPQSAPTKRPEPYTPPSYTESSDDYSSDYSAPSSGSSQSSPSFSSSSLGSSGFSSGSSAGSSYSPSSPSSSSSSSSSFSSSGHSSHSQPSSSYRPTSSSRPSYPTRSLGIPIASFRVAPSSSSSPASSGYSSGGAQASTIREVNVPLPIAFANQPLQGYYF